MRIVIRPYTPTDTPLCVRVYTRHDSHDVGATRTRDDKSFYDGRDAARRAAGTVIMAQPVHVSSSSRLALAVTTTWFERRAATKCPTRRRRYRSRADGETVFVFFKRRRLYKRTRGRRRKSGATGEDSSVFTAPESKTDGWAVKRGGTETSSTLSRTQRLYFKDRNRGKKKRKKRIVSVTRE